MKKALIVTNTASMVHLFNGVSMELLLHAGYEVHIACNFYSGNTVSQAAIEEYKKQWDKKGIVSHHIGFLRSPFSLKSFSIYRQIRKLLRENHFDLIHCHTPIVSILTRLAAMKQRREGKTKVIYTAHGFHFYDGCPKKNWILYYTAEKLFALFTDTLITINHEDYERALAHLHAKQVIQVNGVGIDTEQIALTQCDRGGIRAALGIPENAVVLMSVGELNNNKNHIKVIEALHQCKNKKLHYVICGIGYTREKLMAAAEAFGLSGRLHLLGFREDVLSILKASDIFVFPSIREGLSVALMEAMALGMPVIASKIRGNVDLIREFDGGFLCDRCDAECFAKAIDVLAAEGGLRQRMGTFNKSVIKKYDKKIVCRQLSKILLDADEPAVCSYEVMRVEV